MGGTGDSAAIFRAVAIEKHFGPVHALRGVDFTVRSGEIVALIGDNGAGKSTLVNVLTGVLRPDAGTMLFDERPVSFDSPQEARRHGIETVYQDLAIAPHLDAVANIFLGRETLRSGFLGRMGFLDNGRMRRETVRQLERLRVRVPGLNRKMTTLSGGQRQGVAVARAVMWASRVVFMDEPTAALSVAQTGQVLDLMQQVRDQGIPVVFISHNMPNVFQVADRIVVLRLGRVVAEFDPNRATIDDAVAAMTGSAQAAEPMEVGGG